jgi:hypothetical protein
MSAEAAAVVRSWAVGRYTVTVTAPKPRPGQVMHILMEWSPEQPKRLTPAEAEQYRTGRDKALRCLGLPALVVDV